MSNHTMILVARWTPWSPWIESTSEFTRERDLKIGSAVIATEIQHRTKPDHLWKEGNFFSIQIGREQSYPAFRTRRAALKLLKRLA